MYLIGYLLANLSILTFFYHFQAFLPVAVLAVSRQFVEQMGQITAGRLGFRHHTQSTNKLLLITMSMNHRKQVRRGPKSKQHLTADGISREKRHVCCLTAVQWEVYECRDQIYTCIYLHFRFLFHKRKIAFSNFF